MIRRFVAANHEGKTLKTLIATLALTLSAVTFAGAAPYNSQSARQDREYKSLSAATQRAYGTSGSSSRTYRPPATTGKRRY